MSDNEMIWFSVYIVLLGISWTYVWSIHSAYNYQQYLEEMKKFTMKAKPKREYIVDYETICAIRKGLTSIEEIKKKIENEKS